MYTQKCIYIYLHTIHNHFAMKPPPAHLVQCCRHVSLHKVRACSKIYYILKYDLIYI